MKSLFWSLLACLSIKCFVHQCVGAPGQSSGTNVFSLEIPNVSEIGGAVSKYWSRIYKVQGIPWQVLLKKEETLDESWFTFHLFCSLENVPPNWTHPANLFIKVLPISGSSSRFIQTLERYTEPFIFDHSRKGSGPILIKWDSLMNGDSPFVKNDRIKLEIEIITPNPNDVNKSTMISKTLGKCCDEGDMAKYELKINNINNLMAVQLPEIKLRGLPWYFQAFKQHSNYLGLRLLSKYSEQFPYRVKMSMSMRLESTKKNGYKSANRSREIPYSGIMTIEEIVSWDELLASKNGFVRNNSITITLELTAEILDGPVHNHVCASASTSTSSKQIN